MVTCCDTKSIRAQRELGQSPNDPHVTTGCLAAYRFILGGQSVGDKPTSVLTTVFHGSFMNGDRRYDQKIAE